MIIWQGTDLRTREAITVLDQPLRLIVGAIGLRDWSVGHEAMQRFVIVTSATLGTACIVHVKVERESLVIEAVASEDVHSGRYQMALRTARDEIEREIELERLWNPPKTGSGFRTPRRS